MTRIAVLTPYAPPIPGGISTFVFGLSRTLAKSGHEVYLFAGEGDGDQNDRSNLGVGRTYISNVGRGLQEVRPEVIHCHSHWPTLAGGLRYARRSPGTRLIFSFHTTSTPSLRWAFARLLRNARVLTFVCSAQLAELRDELRLGGDNRLLRPATEVMTVDPARAKRFAEAWALDGAFPVLMFAGPLEYPRKVAGVLELVKAFRNLRSDYPEARLLVLGDGTLRPRIEAESNDLRSAVTVTGFVGDTRAGLVNADLYCHISKQEGLPTALLEAMSLGRCVVASRIGGIPEVIDGSNGSIVGPDPRDLETTIRDLVNDADRRRRLGEGARGTIERAYTWDARLPEVSSIYGLAG